MAKPLRDQKMTLTAKHIRRPSSSNMLLKDYLRDDLSSCSSSGFKSFPRRQCCTAVRFDLLEKDLQAKRNRLLRPTSISHRSSCSFKVASSTISALHKASRAVISAIKLLPFPSISPTPSSPSSSYRKNNSMKRLLSKSLSRKMLSRSFWRKPNEEGEEEEEEESELPRWKSFRELLEEKEKPPPPDQHTQSTSSVISVTLGSSSTSGSSSGKSNGNSWGSSSDFTWEILRSTSDNSEDVGVVSSENTTVQKTTTATRTTSEDSTDGCTLEKIMDWAREEKEQLSPVSVLNGPFGDDEEINSPLDCTSCCRLEGETIRGSKNKQTHKSRHFDDVASSLKPIDLKKRTAIFSEANEKSKNSEEKAWMLINELEISSRLNRAEKKLLLDLFNNTENGDQVSKVAKEWISGEWQGVSNVGWEVCVREMDKSERWTNISDEQVGIQLEFEVLTSLMNELILELITLSQ